MSTRTLAALQPRRRRDVVVQELAGELLVYDRIRKRAHCLAPDAAAFWDACDGETPVSRLVDSWDGTEPLAAAAVLLRRLSRAHLLEAPFDVPPDLVLPRRGALRRLVAGTTTLAVTSLLVPNVAMAATCIPDATCMNTPQTPGNSCGGRPCCNTPSRNCKKPSGGTFCACT